MKKYLISILLFAITTVAYADHLTCKVKSKNAREPMVLELTITDRQIITDDVTYGYLSTEAPQTKIVAYSLDIYHNENKKYESLFILTLNGIDKDSDIQYIEDIVINKERTIHKGTCKRT